MVEAIVNDFAENTYIIYNEKDAFIIDPGSNYPTMTTFLNEHQLTLKGVLLTHGHYDHIKGLNDLLSAYKQVPIYIHESERDFLFDPNLNLSTYMEKPFKVQDKHVVETINDTNRFTLGDETITVYHTPGHTRGGVSFHYKDYLFTGDCLFKENIGRTDLPTGDHETIIQSCQQLLNTLNDNTVVYPGHGPFTTIAHERLNNPHL